MWEALALILLALAGKSIPGTITAGATTTAAKLPSQTVKFAATLDETGGVTYIATSTPAPMPATAGINPVKPTAPEIQAATASQIALDVAAIKQANAVLDAAGLAWRTGQSDPNLTSASQSQLAGQLNAAVETLVSAEGSYQSDMTGQHIVYDPAAWYPGYPFQGGGSAPTGPDLSQYPAGTIVANNGQIVGPNDFPVSN